MFVSRSFRFTFDVFSFYALLSSKNAPHSFLLQKTHTCHGYLSELCVHCRVFFFFRRNGGDMRYKRVQELYQGVQGN